MSKPKRSGTRIATKQHGPKRKMFHAYPKTMRITLGQAGVLSKYYDRESFSQACQARGVRAITDTMWDTFSALRSIAAKDEWFAQLKK